MIQIGRNIRWDIPYEEEVAFSKKIGCEFMQIWFLKGDILIETNGLDKIALIKEMGYPVIVHGVIDVIDFRKDVIDLIDVLERLGLKEVIIHPTCKVNPIDDYSHQLLINEVKWASELLFAKGIKLYLENNCRATPFHYRKEEFASVLNHSEKVELLLDIAHVDSYEHLQSLIDVRYPKMLHLADKHFNVAHEHLPVEDGELDFSYIFGDLLKVYEGKIILEITQNNPSIEKSVERIKETLTKTKE